jgi:hypothetical protein
MLAWLRPMIWTFSGSGSRLRWSRRHFRRVMTELHRRSEDRHESGAFLLGQRVNHVRDVVEAIYFDDLDPHVYASGVCAISGECIARVFTICHQRNLVLIGDVLTHNGAEVRSDPDRDHPAISERGHIRLFVPNFARPPIAPMDLGAYRYRSGHRWSLRGSCV